MNRENSVFVHPRALCESEDVGGGTKIWAFAHVMKDAHIGTDCNVGDHTFIESGAHVGDRVTVKNMVSIWNGVFIEDEVFVGPAVVFTNDLHPRSPRMARKEVSARYRDPAKWLVATRVCHGASIGAGAIILAGVTIGNYAMVAAGAVVTKDVAPHTLAIGNPARPLGIVCYCGKSLKNDRCVDCGENFTK